MRLSILITSLIVLIGMFCICCTHRKTTSTYRIARDTSSWTTETGKLAVMGTSTGGYLAWRFIIDHPGIATAAVMVAPAYDPAPTEIQLMDKLNQNIWIIHGKKDKNCPINMFTGSSARKLEEQKTYASQFLTPCGLVTRKLYTTMMLHISANILLSLQ